MILIKRGGMVGELLLLCVLWVCFGLFFRMEGDGERGGEEEEEDERG